MGIVMKKLFKTLGLVSAIALPLAVSMPVSALERPNFDVTGIATSSLDLFATDQGGDPVSSLDAASVSLPLPVQAVSDSGMYLLKINGKKYWVDSLQVETNETGLTTGGCVKTAQSAAPVPLGVRGLGKGC